MTTAVDAQSETVSVEQVFPRDISPLDGEKILGRARISLGIYWKAASVFVLSILVGFIAGELGGFLFLIALLTFLYFYAVKHFLFLVVTNKRILVRRGVLRIDTMQIALDRVESVEIERTPLGAVLDYGTLIVTGMGSRFAAVPFVDQPAKLRNVIEHILQKSRAG